MRRADILVIDEPTASMDAESEVKIFERFREVTDDKIAIVISHRFSTVRMADQIIVLDRGSIRSRLLQRRNGLHQPISTRLAVDADRIRSWSWVVVRR
jgi:ABC-type multidrug transport system fused ATPase/permease subunit